MNDSRTTPRTGGYRLEPKGGPRVRTDIVDVFIFRMPDDDAKIIEPLLLKRASSPLMNTWQPVMGHVEPGESTVQTARREVREEVGLDPTSKHIWGAWVLEQVHPYYVAAIDSIVLSPRFAVRVQPDWQPVLNAEHSDFKWLRICVDSPQAALGQLLWPGQRHAVMEIMKNLLDPDASTACTLAIDWRGGVNC